MSSASSLQCVPSVCRAILASLVREGEDARFFLEPVSHQLADYPLLIRSAVDLGTVRARLDASPHRYAGEQFASDVRRVFRNAMLYNRPEDPVYVSALKLLDLFEELWARFAATPPPRAPFREREAAEDEKSAAAVAAVGAQPALKRIRLKTAATPATPATPAGQPSKNKEVRKRELSAGVHKTRLEALLVFFEALEAGETLEEATKNTLVKWATVVDTYDLSELRSEAAEIVSALENCYASAAEISAWLAKLLETADPQKINTVFYVIAVIASDPLPCVDVVSLALSPVYVKNNKLWATMASEIARSPSTTLLLDIFKKVIARFPDATACLDTLLQALSSSRQTAVETALDEFVTWVLVNCSATAQAEVLSVVSRRVTRLRETIGRLLLNVVLQKQSSNLDDLSRIFGLCYGAGGSKSTMLEELLCAGHWDKASAVVKSLIATSTKRGDLVDVIGQLLTDCRAAALRSVDLQKLETSAVQDLVQAVCTLPHEFVRPTLQPFLECSKEASSRARSAFAGMIMKQYAAYASGSTFEGLFSAFFSLVSLPNALPSDIVGPVVSRLVVLLKASSCKLQHVLKALFLVRFLPKTSYNTWEEERTRLLASLQTWSAETKKEMEILDSFEKRSLFVNRAAEQSK